MRMREKKRGMKSSSWTESLWNKGFSGLAGVRRDLLRQRVLKLAIVKWSSPQSTAFEMEFIPIDSDYP
ncbi:hypothetical protein TNCT_157611 [Trichonephila clavata]|uniref:Uncharacterized protein n=1 Tax=Trichonephila clavata TaxID=2740835 RepID=A0A8X6GVY9_TRICU|nr:hypothetical protein TNCT_157611 [Trichonephila clavata]